MTDWLHSFRALHQSEQMLTICLFAAVETTAHVAATLHFSFLARVMGEFLFNLHDVGDGGVLALR
eukprot:m.50218 g.50218  ORF g.50218 m.50218 type:complete len:65 (+) comp11148_c0_seq2:141-335(+)